MLVISEPSQLSYMLNLKEVNCPSEYWGLPFKSNSFLIKRVHSLHEASISVGSVAFDNLCVVNQPAVKQDGNCVRLNKYCFLVGAVVDDSIAAYAHGEHMAAPFACLKNQLPKEKHCSA
jgi:hypothetical protein